MFCMCGYACGSAYVSVMCACEGVCMWKCICECHVCACEGVCMWKCIHCATAFSMQSLHINHMQMSIIEVFICRRLHMNTSMILICIWLVCRLGTALHTKCCGAVICECHVCTCVGVCMCGCVHVWVCACVGVCMCGCVHVWVCKCVGV